MTKTTITPDNEEGAVFFGARKIAPAEKSARVRQLFAEVAPAYDLMNDLMSFGLHRLWKDALVARLAPRPRELILDLAGGTGDIAFRLYQATGGQVRVIVADATPEMLAQGQERAFSKGIVSHPPRSRMFNSRAGDDFGVAWCCADAEDLPFADNSFDAITLAFGLRNMTQPETALAEAFRVLEVGGRIAVLEFARPDTPIFARAYESFARTALPALGKQIADNEDAYRYLVESIESFVAPEVVKAWLEGAGFCQVKSEVYAGGVAALHLGWKF